MKELDFKTMNINLIISGGGFRATLFHLGVAKHIVKLNLFDKIRVISSVSGGSILNALISLHFEKIKSEEDFIKLIEKPIIKMIKGDFRNNVLLHTFFAIKSKSVKKMLDEKLFHNKKMSELSSKLTTIINATDINQGRRWIFTQDTFGGFDHDYSDETDKISISKAVHSSMAFPGLVSPEIINKGDYNFPIKDDAAKKIQLIDGIVSDEKDDKKFKGLNLHEAVIVGHMVRIYKLYDQIVFFVTENKGEISSIFFRLLFETYVKMKYFILCGQGSIDSFIKSSFKAPIRNYRYILEQKDDGVLDTIGRRIITKIENRLKFVNLPVDEMLSNRNWKIDGKSFSGILDFLEKNDTNGMKWKLSESFLFGSSSAFVHGNWYDIQLNQLEFVNEKFFPKYFYNKVDPRYILPNSSVPIHACIDYLQWRSINSNNPLNVVLNRMLELNHYLNEVDESRNHNY